ncbi:MAG: hypothetical protein D6E12_05835 [Desulfovibrio sp.]|nr:MAG: hypothetical protein D6E12_05835 [Desulfovibrio sp.]
MGQEPDLHFTVQPAEHGNAFRVFLSPGDESTSLARLAALLAGSISPYSSRIDMSVENQSYEFRFNADRVELSKWGMGSLRREVLLALAKGGEDEA